MQAVVTDITERVQAEERCGRVRNATVICSKRSQFVCGKRIISKLKSYLDELRSSGVTDLQAYFQAHPEDLVHCASLVEIIDANETAVQLAGVESKEQLLGNLDERFIDKSYNSFQKEIIALYEGGGVFQGENISKSPQGNTIYSEINGKIAAGYEDTWDRYLVSQMDITERVRAEKALRENEKLLRTIADNYPNSYISIIEKDFTAGFTSGQEFKKQNLDPEQFIGLPLEQVFDDQATIVRGHYEKTFDGEERSFELFVNDQYQYYRIVPLYAEDGSIPRILAVVENITERKQAEFDLRESEERFRTIFETEPECVKMLNPDTTLVTMNPAGLAMIEAESLDLVQGQSILPIIDEEFRDDFKKLTDNVCQKGQSGMLEFRITGLKGTSRWLETHAVPLRNAEGDVTGLLGITRDITERKKSEQTFQKQEAELQSIFRAAPIGIGMTIDRVIQEANRMLCQITGYTRDELIGQSARMLYPSTEEYEYVGDAKYRMIQERGIGTVETRWKRKDGDVRDILLSSVPLDPDDFSKGVTFTALDITERKQAEDDLRVALTKYKTLFNAVPLGITVSDAAGDILKSNAMAEKLLGLSPDEQAQRAIDGSEWRIVRPDGTPMPADEYASVRALKEKRLVDNVEMGIVKSKEVITWLSVTADLLPLEGYGVVIAYSDISDRKQAELAVKESEERYRNIVVSSPLGMHMYELQAPNKLVFSGSNPAADEILGVDNSIFVGKTIEEAFPPLVNTEVPERYKIAAEKGVLLEN